MTGEAGAMAEARAFAKATGQGPGMSGQVHEVKEILVMGGEASESTRTRGDVAELVSPTEFP